MERVSLEYDVVVVGGGLAGVCAAIAAARADVRVALVQNRPVLGGNSSSEIRVWVCGATAHGVQQFARETGIMGELFLENQYTNPDGNPYYWDLVLTEAVRAEDGIDLFLNTDVREVDAEGAADDRRIRSVTGWQMGSERVIVYSATTFVDCSGDGLVGALAGAEYRTGRESRDMFGESWAPEKPDSNMLGSTILFYSKDAGHPVKFVPPTFARDISQTAIPKRRMIRTDMKGCAYWWIEWGGELDIVADNEAIRDELHAVVYGIWDHIKNSGEFDADTLTLEWIGSVPGKREYRRFIGDHTLSQDEVIGQVHFPDAVAFGGWSIDLHPAGGVYADEDGAYHWHPDGNYHVPLRCLYSVNVSNMFMAGRNISATHVAFGGTRVMATCAVLGEAAGIAAALTVARQLTPRQLAVERFDLMRRALVRADASVLGLRNDDPADLALTATARASSTLSTLAVESPSGRVELDESIGLILPVEPSLDRFEILVDADDDTELVVELHETSKPQNYLPARELLSRRVPVRAGSRQWVGVDLNWSPATPQNAFVVIRDNASISVHTSDEALPGTLFFRHRIPVDGQRNTLYFREWKPILKRQSLCMRVNGGTHAFHARKVVGGYARPYGGPQMWASAPSSADARPSISLEWPEPVTLDEIVLVFDDEVGEDLINLHHHSTPFDVLPGLVRDYELVIGDDPASPPAVRVSGNRVRCRRHRFDQPVTTRRVTLNVHATNGAPRAHVFAIRSYLTATPAVGDDTWLPASPTAVT